MNMIHLQPFLEAMDANRPDDLSQHLSGDVVIKSPFVSEAFVGREAVTNVLRALLFGIDQFETTGLVADGDRAAVFLRIQAGDTEVTGVDDLTVDTGGFIKSMSVQWRPLAAVVAMQGKLAPYFGIPALKLVEASPP